MGEEIISRSAIVRDIRPLAVQPVTRPGADVIVPETSWDHGTLVTLLEGWELACAHPAAADRRCEICPDG
jgi:hypothetical protein